MALSRYCELRAPSESDLAWLHDLASTPPADTFWRLRGLSLSPADFEAFLYRDVLAQYVVANKATAEPAGFVQAYGASLTQGVASLSVIIDQSFVRAGWPLEGVEMFIDRLFDEFPLRKVYARTLSNVDALASLTKFFPFELEATLREDEFAQGEWQDCYVYAVDRDAWHGRRFRITK